MKLFLVLVLAVVCGTVHAKDVNILEFGAVPDGKTLNTSAIQKAIDHCAATGGGMVTVPYGTYLTGTIYLKSNLDLHIQKGGILLGSTRDEDFTRTLIFGDSLVNTSITGEGTIDGQGFLTNFPKKSNRHRNVLFERCRDITVKGITLKNSSTWVMHISKSEGVIIQGVRIQSYSNENNDGIDIDNSRNVVIADCIIDCEDDAIVIKSGDARYDVENIAVTNCIISTNCNALKFGTSSKGVFRNVSMSNCVIRKPTNTDHRKWGKVQGVSNDYVVISGIALEVVDGGIMDQVVISNITMTGVLTPIFIRLGNRRGHGILKNVLISNVTATNESMMSSSINGVPGSYAENITIKDVIFNNRGRATAKEATDTVPENIAGYPENMMFGYSLPAYGLYLRHAKNVVLENIQLQLAAPDARPAIVTDDCHNVQLKGFRADTPQDGQSLLRFIGSTNIIVSGYHSAEPVALFARIEGSTSSDIKFSGNDFTKVKTVSVFNNGAKKSALKAMFNYNN